MDYCDTTYMCGNSTDLQQLQLVQNAACRIILRKPMDTSIKSMHQESNIPTLGDRRTYHVLIECHKNIYNTDASLKYMFVCESDIRERCTRNTDTQSMFIPHYRTVTGRKAFSFRGPQTCNSLNRPIRMIESLNAFKSEILKDVMRDVNHPG